MKHARSIMQASKSTILLCVGVAFACLFRLYLADSQSYWALSGYYDDAMQAQEAANLLQGAWLGEYTQTALIKGVAFPAFLALSQAFHLRYGTALGIVICLSGVIFLFALRKYCSNRLLLFLAFCLVLYCPIAWGSDAGLRIYRNALAPWTTLIIFSCLLALYQLRRARIANLLPWLILLGLALAFVVNLREDSVWMYPAIGVTLLAVLLAQIRTPSPRRTCQNRWRQAFRAVLLPLIPIAISCLSVVGVAAINQHYYDVSLANDRTQGSFADMIKGISSIENDWKDPRSQWVTKEMLLQALHASPTLNSIEDKVLESYDSWTGRFGNGTIQGDYLQWVMRTAMDNAGLYQTAKTAQDFSNAVADELKEAFDNGSLQSDSLMHPSSQGPGLSIADCINFLPDFATNTAQVISFNTLKERFPVYTELNETELAPFQQATGLSFSKEAQDAGYRTAQIESAITVLYQHIGIALFGLAIILFVTSLIISIKVNTTRRFAPFAINGCLVLISTLLCIYVVTIFVAFLGGPWPLQFYATSAYILILVFDTIAILGFADVASAIRSMSGKSSPTVPNGLGLEKHRKE